MKWGLVAAFAALSTAGCVRSDGSRASNCYTGSALAAAGRGMQGRQSATADALEGIRCDEIAREEAAERRERERRWREQKAERTARRAQAVAQQERDAEQLAAIRSAPEVPELGATEKEAKAICWRQRGQARRVGFATVCRVGGKPIFAATLNDDGTFDRVDAYYEGQTIGAMRKRMITALGEPEETKVIDGFRVLLWKNGHIALAGYDLGVRTTFIVPTVAAESTSTSE